MLVVTGDVQAAFVALNSRISELSTDSQTPIANNETFATTSSQNSKQTKLTFLIENLTTARN